MQFAKFEILLLDDALEFLRNQNENASCKILYNIDKSRYKTDPKLFKKMTSDIWEFRTNYGGIQYRLLAFWDKTKSNPTLVIATHGIIKKVDKMPEKEINKAIELRSKYFKNLKKS